MRTPTAGQLTALAALDRSTHAWVEVEDADGDFIDITSLSGIDWFDDCSISFREDNPISSATVTLRREVGSLSVAPLMEGSTLNRDNSAAYAPLINAGREVRIYTATALRGVTKASALSSRDLLWRGTIDEPSFGGTRSKLSFSARDPGALLHDTMIEVEREYGSDSSPVPMQTVIQSILDDNLGVGVVSLTTVGDPDFGIFAYKLARVTIMEAIQTLAALNGWSLRYKWNGSDFALTLYEPARTNTTPAYTFDADDYYDITEMKLSRVGIRNAATVLYSDSDGVEQSITLTRPTSIAEYDRRFALFDERKSSIRTSTQATRFLNAILDDTSTPPITKRVDSSFFWPAELGDVYQWNANGVHYDTAQVLAVFAFTHVISATQVRTQFECSGQPRGGYRRWHIREKHDVAVPAPFGTLSVNVDQDTRALTFNANGDVDALSFKWAATTNGTVPATPTTTVDARSAQGVSTGLTVPSGGRGYVTVWFFSGANGTEVRGEPISVYADHVESTGTGTTDDIDILGLTAIWGAPSFDDAYVDADLLFGSSVASITVNVSDTADPSPAPGINHSYTFNVTGPDAITHRIKQSDGSTDQAWPDARTRPPTKVDVTAYSGANGTGSVVGTGTMILHFDQGVTAVSGGGTGVTSIAAASLVIGQGVSPVSTLAPGAASTVVRSTGSAWQAVQLGFSDLSGSLDASKITGTLAAAQIPGLDASKITSGVFSPIYIPTTFTTMMTFNGGITVGGDTVGTLFRRPDNTGQLQFSGGSTAFSSSGGVIRLYGNSEPNFPGIVVIGAGTASGSTIDLQQGGVTRFQVHSTGTTTTGLATFSTGVEVTGGTSGAGRIYFNSFDGLVIRGKAGADRDLLLANAAGSTIFQVRPSVQYVEFNAGLRAQGGFGAADGVGLEVYYDTPSTTGVIQAYDRDAAAYRALSLLGSEVRVFSNGTLRTTWTTFGNLVQSGGAIQVKGPTQNGLSGLGVELRVAGGVPGVLAYDRTASAYHPLELEASEVRMMVGGVQRATFNSSGLNLHSHALSGVNSISAEGATFTALVTVENMTINNSANIGGNPIPNLVVTTGTPSGTYPNNTLIVVTS